MSAAPRELLPSSAEALVAARRLVVKIGSVLLAAENGEVRRPWLAALAATSPAVEGAGRR